MKAVFLDCPPFVEGLLGPELRSILPDLHINVGDPEDAHLSQLLRNAVGIIDDHTLLDRAILKRSTKLKTIVYLGTGASNYIDLEAAQELGIRVRTIKGYGDRTVAEHTFALIFSAARQIASMDRALRAGRWDSLSGVELHRKTLGVIGVGGIGSEVVRIGAALGMQVLAWNRSPVSPDLPCQPVELDRLLASSDVISLHLSLNPETQGIVDARRIELIRPSTILINTARGALIDEQALVRALRAGKIAHAALDVFHTEPLQRDHPFIAMDNVTLTAHAAFQTAEACMRLTKLGFELLRDDLKAIE